MKNKEIEELLNELKDKYSYEPYDTTGKVYTTISYEEGQLLLSYIEQLQTTANKCKQLEINRDKAIEYVEHHKFNKFGDIDCNEAEDIIDILKGDSDDK